MEFGRQGYRSLADCWGCHAVFFRDLSGNTFRRNWEFIGMIGVASKANLQGARGQQNEHKRFVEQTRV